MLDCSQTMKRKSEGALCNNTLEDTLYTCSLFVVLFRLPVSPLSNLSPPEGLETRNKESLEAKSGLGVLIIMCEAEDGFLWRQCPWDRNVINDASLKKTFVTMTCFFNVAALNFKLNKEHGTRFKWQGSLLCSPSGPFPEAQQQKLMEWKCCDLIKCAFALRKD